MRLSPSVKSLRLRPGAHRVARAVVCPATLWEAIASRKTRENDECLKRYNNSTTTLPSQPNSIFSLSLSNLSLSLSPRDPFTVDQASMTLHFVPHGLTARPVTTSQKPLDGDLDASSAALGRPLISFTDFLKSFFFFFFFSYYLSPSRLSFNFLLQFRIAFAIEATEWEYCRSSETN